MKCSYCGQDILEQDSHLCPNCKKDLHFLYHSPPDDFLLDPGSSLYYKETTQAETESDFRSILWFDPKTGTYHEAIYPVEIPEPAIATQENQKKPFYKKVLPFLLVFLLLFGIGAAWWFGLFEGILYGSESDTASISAEKIVTPSLPSPTSKPFPTQPQKEPTIQIEPKITPTKIPDPILEPSPIPKPEGDGFGFFYDTTQKTYDLIGDFQNVTLTVTPRSATEAVFQLEGLLFQDVYPTNFDDTQTDDCIYQWELQFENYSAGLTFFQTENLADTVTLEEMQSGLWFQNGFSSNLLETNEEFAKVTREDGLLKIHVKLHPDSPMDFTTFENYEFKHTYGKTTFSEYCQPLILSSSLALPMEDKTGYVYDYKWFDHISYYDPAFPNGKWVGEDGQMILYLDHPVDSQFIHSYLVMKQENGDLLTQEFKLTPGKKNTLESIENKQILFTLESQEDGKILLRLPLTDSFSNLEELSFLLTLSWAREDEAAKGLVQEIAPTKSPEKETKMDPMMDILPGTYVNEISLSGDLYQEEYAPRINLYKNSNFTFLVNLAEGMGTITGSYVYEDEMVCLKVENIDFNGFIGDDASEIYLYYLDGNLHLLSPQLGLSMPGSEFIGR